MGPDSGPALSNAGLENPSYAEELSMAFRFDKLTIKAQEAVAGAQSLALEQGHPEVDVLHLLSALLSETEGVVEPMLVKVGVNVQQLKGMVDSELARLPKVSGGGQPNLSRNLQEVLEASAKQAAQMKDEFVSTEHLLLALTKIASKAKKILEANAIRESDLLSAMQSVRGTTRVTDQNPEGKYQALQKYGIEPPAPGADDDETSGASFERMAAGLSGEGAVRLIEEVNDHAGKRAWIGRRYQQPGRAVDDELGRAPDVGRHNRQAGHHRLDHEI